MLNYTICKTQAPLNFSLTFFYHHKPWDSWGLWSTKSAHFGLILSLFRISGHWRLMHSQDKTPWFGYAFLSSMFTHSSKIKFKSFCKAFKGTSIVNRPRVGWQTWVWVLLLSAAGLRALRTIIQSAWASAFSSMKLGSNRVFGRIQ